MAKRCRKHGLALDPAGHCVLCRRDEPERPTPRRGPIIALLLLGLLAGGGWLLFEWASRAKQPGARAKAQGRASPRAPGASSDTSDASPRPPFKQGTMRFEQHHALSTPTELMTRASLLTKSEYSLEHESFEVFVPPSYDKQTPHGLLVWIDAGHRGAIRRPEWTRVLSESRVMWAGPNRIGNNRPVEIRIRLALDAVRAVSEELKVDRGRVFVAGFSGGAKSALRTLLAFPDIFHGAVLCAGADYFRELPARSRGEGQIWPARFERPRDLHVAKRRRIALVTGKRDFNFGHVSDVYAGMKNDGFLSARLFADSNLDHVPPGAELFADAISWVLDAE